MLMSQWQSSDGMLPITDKELARLSGLFSRWKDFRDEILENFVKSGRTSNKHCPIFRMAEGKANI